MNATQSSVSVEQVEALRAFNRFYTQRIGVLAPYLGSKLSLTEARVLYELAHHSNRGQGRLGASALGAALGLDAGYLSRILRRFEARGWISKAPHPLDARQSLLTLTRAGRAVLAPLQRESTAQAATLLQALEPAQRAELAVALATTRRLLGPSPQPSVSPSVSLREPKPGDIGWVVQQHGAVYATEYGWDLGFEAMVADIAARFVKHFKPQWERCWMATADGRTVGSVFIVRKSRHVAQLRMLILLPEARGLGLGSLLTDTCIEFARAKGYRKMVLWTNSCLTAARALYERRGFRLVRSEPYQGFGQELTGEHWELTL